MKAAYDTLVNGLNYLELQFVTVRLMQHQLKLRTIRVVLAMTMKVDIRDGKLVQGVCIIASPLQMVSACHCLAPRAFQSDSTSESNATALRVQIALLPKPARPI